MHTMTVNSPYDSTAARVPPSRSARIAVWVGGFVGGLAVAFPALVIGCFAFIRDDLPLPEATRQWSNLAAFALFTCYAMTGVMIGLAARAVLLRRFGAFLVALGITVGLFAVYLVAISRYWAR